MSSGAQTIVGAGGAGLLALNFWTGPTRKIMNDGLFNSGASSAQKQAAKNQLVKVGAAALFVVIATLLAGTSAGTGRVMATMVAALFVLFLINKTAPAKGK